MTRIRRCRTTLVRALFAVGVSLALASCALRSAPGQVSPGFRTPQLQAAFLPLNARGPWLVDHWGAGFVIAPNIAVTNAHNYNLIAPEAYLARSPEHDLMFYRTDRTTPAPLGRARVGMEVIAYGQGQKRELREAAGVVRDLDFLVQGECPTCPVQHVMAFDADAGPGFSGGPVVDAQSNAVVGILFGFTRDDARRGGPSVPHYMFAYDIQTVLAEMRRLLPQARR
jgi:hypothetical protein